MFCKDESLWIWRALSTPSDQVGHGGLRQDAWGGEEGRSAHQCSKIMGRRLAAEKERVKPKSWWHDVPLFSIFLQSKIYLLTSYFSGNCILMCLFSSLFLFEHSFPCKKAILFFSLFTRKKCSKWIGTENKGDGAQPEIQKPLSKKENNYFWGYFSYIVLGWKLWNLHCLEYSK